MYKSYDRRSGEEEKRYLRVSSENLVLDFINVAIDRGQKLFPTDAQRFHGVLSVSVFEDHAFLDSLMDLLQFLEMSLVLIHRLFVFLQTMQLILQSSLKRRQEIDARRNTRTHF